VPVGKKTPVTVEKLSCGGFLVYGATDFEDAALVSLNGVIFTWDPLHGRLDSTPRAGFLWQLERWKVLQEALDFVAGDPVRINALLAAYEVGREAVMSLINYFSPEEMRTIEAAKRVSEQAMQSVTDTLCILKAGKRPR